LSTPKAIPVRDRASGRVFQEFMDDSKPTYESKPRRSIAQWISSSPTIDWLVAAYQNTRWSARKIEPFVRKHRIDMLEFEPGPYRTYSDFFERKFRPGKRPFPEERGTMGAFAEARYFAWEKLDLEMQFPIKGQSLRPELLLDDRKLAQQFQGGPVMLARLAPVDYHHLHYVDAGMTKRVNRLGRRLWTVNPNALRHQPDIPFQNERSIQVLETENFGCITLVEIGALSVGRIVQEHDTNKPFKRGDRKAVFRFGGSAVVMFGEEGRWTPAEDLLRTTAEGLETFVRLGEPVAHAL
jgi:phosphatidylserine decarboxylase